MAGPGPQAGEAEAEAAAKGAAIGSPAGSSPKHSQRSWEGTGMHAALHAAGRPSEPSSEEEVEHLPPHVARLTRQSVELIEQVNALQSLLHSTTQLPPAAVAAALPPAGPRPRAAPG